MAKKKEEGPVEAEKVTKTKAYTEDLARALKPFARMSRPEEDDYPEGVICTQGSHCITYGDLALAREVLTSYIKSKKS